MSTRRICAWLVLIGNLIPGLAVAQSRTIEERLAALEQRVAQLEKENHELRARLGRPATDPELPVVASTAGPAVPTVASVVPQPAPQPSPLPSSAPGSLASPSPQVEKKAETKTEAKSDRFQFGGQIRFRAEVRKNVGLNAQHPDVLDFVGQRIRFHVLGKLSDTVETFVEFQDSRLWGQEASRASNERLTDLHQAYLQVNSFLMSGLALRAGRQELAYGAERLIGALGWDNIGRSFDAVKLGYSSKGWWSDVFAAKVVDRRDTGRGDRDQYLYGVYNQFFRHRPQRLEVYGILLRDGLRTPGEIGAQGQKATEIMTFGLRSEGKVDPGINYDLEFAGQFGHRGFDSHSARALTAKMYKTVEEKHQLRLGFEYDMATGDHDPHDGRSGEFVNLFPTNHQHYGYADLMGWRNMQDFRPMFTVMPARPVRFDVDYHRLYLLQAHGPWKNAGGALLGFDPTGKSGTHVGDELDFTLWFPLHKHLKVLSGYALFVPGEFARKTLGPDNQHFVYLQTTVDF